MAFESPAACTLPMAARPVRLAQFRELLGEARQVHRIGDRHLQLRLDEHAAERVADLTARESACCAFFDFRIATVGDRVLLDVLVSPDQVEVLHGLAALATGAR